MTKWPARIHHLMPVYGSPPKGGGDHLKGEAFGKARRSRSQEQAALCAVAEVQPSCLLLWELISR